MATGIFLLKESLSFSGSPFPNVLSSLKKEKRVVGPKYMGP